MQAGFADFQSRYRDRGIHVRHSLFLQPTIVQRESHNLILTHPPVAFAAARRDVHRCGIRSRCQQVAAARAWLLPLLAIIQPHPPPDPCRQAQYRRVGGAEP
jgi:hypothetical protein